MTLAPQVHHRHVLIDAPAPDVFDYVRDLRHMPTWSYHFCRSVEPIGPDEAWMESDMGRVFFAVRPDASTGVVDWWCGPTKEQATRWPVRVVDLAGFALVTITAVCPPGMSEDVVLAHLDDELARLKEVMEGARV